MAIRAFAVGVEGPVLRAEECAFLRDAEPWGVILFARNVVDPEQLSALTASIRAELGRAAPILIDQEGGRVQRLGPPHWRAWLPPLDHVAAANGWARPMYLRALLIAHELQAVGIDVNCAPTCDVATTGTHPFLRNRCLGTDPPAVAAQARAMAEGLLHGGVLPVIKHLPGHGRGRVDSHLSLPSTGADEAALDRVDFVPFRALADLPLGMTAHMTYSALDARPATVSPVIVGLIRNSIRFDGLLMTDDLSMNALGGTLGERALAALAAGCDLVLHCNGDLSEGRALAEVVPLLTGRSAERAEAALARRRPAGEIDIPEVEAELAGLMGGPADG